MHVELDVVDRFDFLDDGPHQLENDVVENIDIPVGFLTDIFPNVQ